MNEHELKVLTARFSALRMICRGRFRLGEHKLERRAPQLFLGRLLRHAGGGRRGQAGRAPTPSPQEAAPAAAAGAAAAVRRGPGGHAQGPRGHAQDPAAAVEREIVASRQRKR